LLAFLKIKKKIETKIKKLSVSFSEDEENKYFNIF